MGFINHPPLTDLGFSPRVEHGAIILEFALVIGLLTAFVAAALDFGWSFRQQNVLYSCARNGARAGSKLWSHEYSCSQLGQVASDVTSNCLTVNGIHSTVITPATSRIVLGGTDNSVISVTAKKPAECFLCFFLQRTATLSATSTFRLEDLSLLCN